MPQASTETPAELPSMWHILGAGVVVHPSQEEVFLFCFVKSLNFVFVFVCRAASLLFTALLALWK
jgi:hypothetical protein